MVVDVPLKGELRWVGRVMLVQQSLVGVTQRVGDIVVRCLVRQSCDLMSRLMTSCQSRPVLQLGRIANKYLFSNNYLQIMNDSTFQMLHLKRETFHVNIRKSKREEVFNMKRSQLMQHPIQTQLGEEIIRMAEQVPSGNQFDQIVGIVQIIEPYIRTANLFDASDRQVKLLVSVLEYLASLTNLCMTGFLYSLSFNLLERCLYGRKSFLRYDDEEEHRRKLIMELIVDSFANSTRNSDSQTIFFIDREEMLLDVINKTDDSNLYYKVLVLIANLIFDDQNLILEYLKRNIIQKVITRLFELGLSNNTETLEVVLHLMLNLAQKHEVFGGYEITQLLQLIFKVTNDTTLNPNLIKKSFQILQMLVKDTNGQTTQILISNFIELELIQRLTSLLIDPLGQFYEADGWTFFVNLSFINDNSLMKVLIDSNLLLAVQCRINSDPAVDHSIYMVLSNLFVSNIFIKESIKESGLLSRIVSGFQMEISKQKSQLLEEINYCIVNAIESSTAAQLTYYLEIELLECPVQYLTEIDVEYQDPMICKEFINVISIACRFLEDYRLRCKQNQRLLDRVFYYRNCTSNIQDLNNNAEQLLAMLEL